ncbi:MAG: hypothetical protein FWH28_04250 [Clostridiales bacterium]|nr:hypothetical protein [Clostridiales bacterium]
MKFYLSLLLAALMLYASAACGGGNSAGTASKLEGPPEEILNQILEETKDSLSDERSMPMAIISEVTADTSQNQIGLSGDDFRQYVSSASVATAAIATFAHEIGLIQAKDAAAAAAIKDRIAGDGGYNSEKWICVMPEKSCVVESGSYVLLAVSRNDVVEAVIAAFTEAAGTVGERNEFFRFEGGVPEGSGGMGLQLN